MTELERLRLKARSLLHLSEPADALYAYYAFYHDPRRTRLHVHEDEEGRADGFVAVCQTGRKLFQPTVALRTPDAQGAEWLLRQALVAGRPYYLITTPDLREVVEGALDVQRSSVNHVYTLDLFRFQAVVNVLVVAERGPDERPRFVIRSQDQVAAQAGVNWSSPHFAEVFVETKPAARKRGWGRAVLAACTQWIVRSAKRPLYVANRSNQASIRLGERVGYSDTGARELACEGICRD